MSLFCISFPRIKLLLQPDICLGEIPTLLIVYNSIIVFVLYCNSSTSLLLHSLSLLTKLYIYGLLGKPMSSSILVLEYVGNQWMFPDVTPSTSEIFARNLVLLCINNFVCLLYLLVIMKPKYLKKEENIWIWMKQEWLKLCNSWFDKYLLTSIICQKLLGI